MSLFWTPIKILLTNCNETKRIKFSTLQILVSSAPAEVQSPVCKQKYKYSNRSSRWFTFTTIEQLDTGDSDSGEDVMMKYTSNDGGQKGD